LYVFLSKYVYLILSCIYNAIINKSKVRESNIFSLNQLELQELSLIWRAKQH